MGFIMTFPYRSRIGFDHIHTLTPSHTPSALLNWYVITVPFTPCLSSLDIHCRSTLAETIKSMLLVHHVVQGFWRSFSEHRSSSGPFGTAITEGWECQCVVSIVPWLMVLEGKEFRTGCLQCWRLLYCTLRHEVKDENHPLVNLIHSSTSLGGKNLWQLLPLPIV